MTTFTSLPTFRSSTTVPPGTPRPSTPPPGPTHPVPTGPNPGRTLIDRAAAQLAPPLAILVEQVLDGDHAPEDRDRLNAAATHVSAALCELANLNSRPPVSGGEEPAPDPSSHGGEDGTRSGAGLRLLEGEHRPIGRVSP